jgi:hypothetical protein
MTDQELRELFEQEARLVSEDAPVPAAGSVWWRSAMRARMDAADAAMRPLFWFQAIAAAAIIGALAALIGAAWPALTHAVSEHGVLQSMGPMPLVAMGAAFLVVIPVALYFALSDR